MSQPFGNEHLQNAMKIGIYKDTFANARGADVAVKWLAAGLAERGHDAVAFEKNALAERLREQWDVIISAGTNELLDLAAAGYSSAPVVQQFHTNPRGQFKWKRFVRNWRIRRALRHVAAIQILQDAFIAQVAKYGPPVAVIGNSVSPVKPFVPEATRKTIIYPAAFAKSKNHKLLLEAFASLSGDFKDWTLELYGNGTAPAVLPPCTKVFSRCDLKEAYSRCAFLAFPSLDEGFGLVVAEAATFGKPAVMVHDWIGTAAAEGGLVTAPTVSAYADGLRRLMSSPDLCRHMGENARRFCLERYSREKILDKWEELLESVAHRNAVLIK